MPEPTAIAEPSQESASAPQERFLKAYRCMVLARILEEKIASLYHSGKLVGGVYTGKGQEAFSAALGVHLEKGTDVYGPLIRDQAGRIAFGEPLTDATRTYFGSVAGPMRGRDGNVHRGRPKEGMPAMISHLGSNIAVLAGMLFARRFQGRVGGIGGVSIGEGGTSTGAFHEGLNLAAIEKLPLIVAVADNQFAYSTPKCRQFACADLIDRAAGYGVAGHAVDGTDLAACLEVFARASANARAGSGPQLVIGKLLRLSGHGEHDDASYVPDSLRHSPLGRDCLEVATAACLDRGILDEAGVAGVRSEAVDRVQSAVNQAQKEPSPDPFTETWSSLSTPHLREGYPASRKQ
ncbi:thiamine pyrophosphate-dependent dehydrogenase E1 component subunit alpha [soil metagenome]